MKRIISYTFIFILFAASIQSCSNKTNFHGKKKGPVSGKAHGSFGHPTK